MKTWLLILLFASTLASLGHTDDIASPETATIVSPFINSLGMKFVPVPRTKVLFCIWDTRVKDFREYAEATNYHQTGGIDRIKADRLSDGIHLTGYFDKTADWEHPGFVQAEENPVVGVSWNEAKAFCAWLSKKEGRVYRLPTSAEWSAAAGPRTYPWGDSWPPPRASGNFGDKAFYATFKVIYHSELGDYNDGFVWTSPVGTFSPNWLGLYDMAGNVCQWCEDWHAPGDSRYDTRKECRIVRGSSWNMANSERLISTFHHGYELFSDPSERQDQYGFRCVLEIPGDDEKK